MHELKKEKIHLFLNKRVIKTALKLLIKFYILHTQEIFLYLAIFTFMMEIKEQIEVQDSINF